MHEAVIAHLRLEDELGGYEAFEARQSQIRAAYDEMGRLLGADRGTSPSPRTRRRHLPRRSATFDFGPGDIILTSRADYASNQIMYLSLARRRGVEIVRAPDLPEGGIDPEAVRALVRSPPAGARGAHLGADQLRAGAAGRGRRRDLPSGGIPYLVDACQAVGQIPIDVGRLSAATISPEPPGSSSVVLGASGFSTSPTVPSRPVPIPCWWTCTAPPGPIRMPSS